MSLGHLPNRARTCAPHSGSQNRIQERVFVQGGQSADPAGHQADGPWQTRPICSLAEDYQYDLITSRLWGWKPTACLFASLSREISTRFAGPTPLVSGLWDTFLRPAADWDVIDPVCPGRARRGQLHVCRGRRTPRVHRVTQRSEPAKEILITSLLPTRCLNAVGPASCPFRPPTGSCGYRFPRPWSRGTASGPSRQSL